MMTRPKLRGRTYSVSNMSGFCRDINYNHKHKAVETLHYRFTYRFEDNISIKGHMQGEALGSIREAVFLDSVASGVALVHSKKPG